MAVAGRVAIVPKGEYDNTIAYERLDMVSYNQKLYIARKDTAGISPDDNTYWMLCTSAEGLMSNYSFLKYNETRDTVRIFEGEKLLCSGEQYDFSFGNKTVQFDRVEYICIHWAFYDPDMSCTVDYTIPTIIPVALNCWGKIPLFSYYSEGHVYSPEELFVGTLMYQCGGILTNRLQLTFNENCRGVLAIGSETSGVSTTLQLDIYSIDFIYK